MKVKDVLKIIYADTVTVSTRSASKWYTVHPYEDDGQYVGVPDDIKNRTVIAINVGDAEATLVYD